jgi:hypothetical protein
MPINAAVCSMIFLTLRPVSSGKAKITQIEIEEGRISGKNV